MTDSHCQAKDSLQVLCRKNGKLLAETDYQFRGYCRLLTMSTHKLLVIQMGLCICKR